MSGLFIGRLVIESGLGTLAEALDLYPGARIDVIGAGPEEARVAGHPRIRLLGPRRLAALRKDRDTRFPARWLLLAMGFRSGVAFRLLLLARGAAAQAARGVQVSRGSGCC